MKYIILSPFLIYGPGQTANRLIPNTIINCLKNAKFKGNKTENGKKMFIYQAAKAFEIWHGIKPEINDEVKKLLDL